MFIGHGFIEERESSLICCLCDGTVWILISYSVLVVLVVLGVVHPVVIYTTPPTKTKMVPIQ